MIKFNIKKILIILLSFSLFSLYFWNRFLRERLPKDIVIVFFSFRFYIILMLLLGFIILLLVSIKNIFYIKKESYLDKILKNKYINYVYYNIIINIQEGPTQFYEWLYEFTPISIIVEPIHEFFFNYNIYNHCQYIIFLLKIWRILVVFAFFLDVFYYEKFYYLYKTIYILIIPLILNFILFIIYHHAKNLVEYLSDFVIVNFSETENCFNIKKNPDCKEEILDNRIPYFGDLYINAQYTYNTFLHLNEMKKKATYYLNLFTCISYLIGWFYCLYISTDFYEKIAPQTIPLYLFFIIIFCFIYNFSLMMSNDRSVYFIFPKIVSLLKKYLGSTTGDNLQNFITLEIEKNIVLFTCIFNFIPKYLSVVLFMVNTLILKIPYIGTIFFLIFLIICSGNLYLYFLNKYLNKKFIKLEYYFGFLTDDTETRLYYKKLTNPREIIIQKTYDANFILKEWIKLKESQTFIFYCVNKKIVLNIYMNCIYYALLFISLFLSCIS